MIIFLLGRYSATPPAPPAAEIILLESNFFILLENANSILLEG